MSDQDPTVWQQCKSIAEALAPTPEPPEQAAQRVRATLLAQLAAGSEKGAALAARLADTDGPIEVSPEDLPDYFRQRQSNRHAVTSS
jgi:hypothetical protein